MRQRLGLQNRSGWSRLGLGQETDILLKTKMSLSSSGLGQQTIWCRVSCFRTHYFCRVKIALRCCVSSVSKWSCQLQSRADDWCMGEGCLSGTQSFCLLSENLLRKNQKSGYLIVEISDRSICILVDQLVERFCFVLNWGETLLLVVDLLGILKSYSLFKPWFKLLAC